MTSPTEYPLAWPYNRPRSRKGGQSSAFRTQLPGALKNVKESLRRFGDDSGKKITGIIISSNCSLGISRPDDPGVAVYFVWNETQVCIAVDRYAKVEDNLQAIHHILEARRTEMRHGGIEIVKASFEGHKALPAAVRFISAEPLLGPVDLEKIALPTFHEGQVTELNALDGDVQSRYPGGGHCETWHGVDWVIVGGESGHGARICRGKWVSEIIHQCARRQVPLFFKQLGAGFIDEHNGVAGAGVKLPDDSPPVTRLTDPKGGDPEEWPTHYRIRQMPSGVTI